MKVLGLTEQDALWKDRERTSSLTCCLSPRPQHGTQRHPIVFAPATEWVPDPALADGGDYRPAAGAGGTSSSACRPPWHSTRDQPGLRPDWLSLPTGAKPNTVSFPWCRGENQGQRYLGRFLRRVERVKPIWTRPWFNLSVSANEKQFKK